jgi:integrase
VLLSGILESAVEYGYLQRNPARGVKFPQKGLKEKPAIIAGESLAKLINELGEPYRTMVQIIAATGLRIGELLALRWSVIDLDNGTLSVRESVFEGRFQPPKTAKALRTIPLGGHAVAALLRHRDGSSRKEPNDLVFGNRKGEPFRESKLLTRVLQPAAEAAGLGLVRGTSSATSIRLCSTTFGCRRRSHRSSSDTRALRRRWASTRTSSTRRTGRQ